MNYRIILLILGRILILVAGAMAPSLAVSLLYKDGIHWSFIVTMAAMLISGIIIMCLLKKQERTMRPREGFVAVALCWIMIVLFGALPPFLSKTIPSFVDALFEMTAGFTTTGATILMSIEDVPKSIVFWRAFSQWLGGMGVLVLTLAIMPAGEHGVFNLVRAESTGPSSERLVPRIRQSAMILYGIYVALTLIQAIMLLIGKMSFFDALLHAFTTAGTGGYSSRDMSVGAYDSAFIDYTIGTFMLLFSVNFGLYFAIATGDFGRIRKNTELKVFGFIILAATILLVVDLLRNNVYDSLSQTIRYAYFHAASLGSSTAFFLVDYNMWPGFSKIVLWCLILIGGCAGSTAGGLKVVRITTLYKSAVREIKKIIHPRSVSVVHVNNSPLQEKDLFSVLHYFVIYAFIVFFATMVVSWDSVGLENAFSGVVAMISNVGPGFGEVGPIGNYTGFSNVSKMVLSAVMLVGRLEIYPMLMLVVPSAWKRA